MDTWLICTEKMNYIQKIWLNQRSIPQKKRTQFRDIKFFTGNNDLVSIISEDVIDNTQIFKRMGIPAPIR